MIIQIQRRAEIAIRSLGRQEQLRINRAVQKLEATSRFDAQSILHLHKLNGMSGLFVFRATPKIRMLLSFEGDVCTIEDLVTPDQLTKITGFAE